MSGDLSRKRKKGYYTKGVQGKRIRQNHYLDAGMKGFLLTCNNREREAVREAYNVLNEYADDIYGPEQAAQKCEDGEDGGDSEDDIEAALKKEVSAIKEKKHTQRRFQVVDSGAKNCVFIRTTVESPRLIIHKMLSDVSVTKQAKSRFIMRVHPVAATCRATEGKFRQLVESCLSEYMETGVAKTYCILIKVRNNNDLTKPEIFPVMRQIIQDMNPNHDFDDKCPDYVFGVDVIKNVFCLSVMEDFYKFRKYNIQEVVKVADDSATPQISIEVVGEVEAADNVNENDTSKGTENVEGTEIVERNESVKETETTDVTEAADRTETVCRTDLSTDTIEAEQAVKIVE